MLGSAGDVSSPSREGSAADAGDSDAKGRLDNFDDELTESNSDTTKKA
jgi:hypothetical protein